MNRPPLSISTGQPPRSGAPPRKPPIPGQNATSMKPISPRKQGGHSLPTSPLNSPLKSPGRRSGSGCGSSTASFASSATVRTGGGIQTNLNSNFTNNGSSSSPRYNSAQQRKMLEINAVLSKPEIDLWALRELCLSDGGLIDDGIRKKAYPKLVGITNKSNTTTTAESSSSPLSTIGYISSSSSSKKKEAPKCIDAHQISLDTARCTWHLLNGHQRVRRNTMRNKHKKRVRALLKRKQKRLGNFINLTLIQSYIYGNNGDDDDEEFDVSNGDGDEKKELMPHEYENSISKLRYYQGYHDISCVILSALGGETTASTAPPSSPSASNFDSKKNIQDIAQEAARNMGMDLPCQILAKLSHSHLEDMMRDNFDILTRALRLVIFPLLHTLDPEVHAHLEQSGMEPFFCLPWIITWFSHDIRDTDVVKRLFDVFVASHPLMPVYLAIAMVLHPMNRMEILGSECDFACLHKALSQLPMNSCSVGWKFMGGPTGGEYVSWEYEEAEDDVSFDGSVMSQDVYREEGGKTGCGDDDSLAPSLASESLLSGFDGSRVPFQELIDLAVTYMSRIPPRSLPQLARKYHGPEIMQKLAANMDAINFLNSPPGWAIASTIESDSPLKKKRRKRGDKILEESIIAARAAEIKTKPKQTDLSKDMRYHHAMIAAGIGPDGDGDARRRRKRRKMMRTGAIVIGVLSILIGVVDRVVPISTRVPIVEVKILTSIDSIRRGEAEVANVCKKDESPIISSTDSSVESESSNIVNPDEEGTEGEISQSDSEDAEPPVEVVEIPDLKDTSAHSEQESSRSIKSGVIPLDTPPPTSDNFKVDSTEGATNNRKINSKRKNKSEVPLIYSGSRSPAAQKVSAFVHQNVKPMYVEARAIAKTTREVVEEKVRSNEVGRRIAREAMVIARSTRDALIDEAEVVLL